MTASARPELDLTVSRIIRAPRPAVWSAWTDPAKFAQWWVPTPQICRVRDMDLRPGGSFRTEISEDGTAFGPHITGCFLPSTTSSASSSPTPSSRAGAPPRRPS